MKKRLSLYAEYTKMRIRERELLCEEVELRKDGAHSTDFLKSCRILARARKKLNEVEKVLSELVPDCKHPKNMRDRSPDGQWYCMACNLDL